MLPRIQFGVGMGSLLILAALANQQTATGCGAVPPPGETVAIADESAIILWNAAAKTQHFIRRASFNTAAKDFGFLVPSPGRPTLAESDDAAFELLAKITAPRVETRPRPSTGCSCSGAKGPGPIGGVNVLEEKRIAGYDAAVLEADDSKALADWLKEHGYQSSPAITDWLRPYVEKGWKITAFKIAKDAPGKPRVATSAVRMSFRAERPFFPYREPAGQGGEPGKSGRLLRVFFLADYKARGVLGESDNAWPGRVVWANRLKGEQRADLLRLLKVPGEELPETPWLTEFEDSSSPRPGKQDVFFGPAGDDTPVERQPQIQYVSGPPAVCLMSCALAAYLLAGHWLIRYRRRGRAEA